MSTFRPATHLNLCDFFRAQASYAKEKAKRMMGAGNPLTGADIRKPASTFCSGCGRWHRPGNVCPAANKSVNTTIGERVTPATLHSQNLLSYKPEPKEEKSHEEKAEELTDNSAHIQNQQEGYLNSLRNWQAKYGQ